MRGSGASRYCVIVAGAVLTLVATGATAQQTSAYGPGHGPWSGPWHGWMFGPIGMLMLVALVVVVVVLVIRLTRQRGNNGEGYPGRPRRQTPLDILKERFARGEIDQAEFEEKRRYLDE